MNRIIVIGLGIFGLNIVKDLFEGGFEVIAIDKNKDAIQNIRDYATKAIVADGMDKEIMKAIGIHEDDTVIISFGEDLAASTLITLHLKQLGVKNIIVKAPNDEHKLILEKVGATDVIIPEKEIARKFSGKLGFWAGFDVQHILREGTPEQVRAEVRFLVDTFDLSSGGMSIAAGNGIVSGTPFENIEAFLDESVRYGRQHRHGRLEYRPFFVCPFCPGTHL